MKIRYGTVQEEKGGYARVLLETAGGNTLTPWLPVPQRSTIGDKDYRPLAKGTLVSMVIDEEGEALIVGAHYNKRDVPPGGSGGDVWVKVFRDGTTISYDAAGKNLAINAAGGVAVQVTGDCSIRAASCTIEASSGQIKGLRCQYTGKKRHNFA